MRSYAYEKPIIRDASRNMIFMQFHNAISHKSSSARLQSIWVPVWMKTAPRSPESMRIFKKTGAPCFEQESGAHCFKKGVLMRMQIYSTIYVNTALWSACSVQSATCTDQSSIDLYDGSSTLETCLIWMLRGIRSLLCTTVTDCFRRYL